MIFKAKKLIIDNFMGGSMEIDLTDETDIFGANRAGKSRLKSAYHWVLTGKNANDESDFEIKDTTNPNKHRHPHRVELHGFVNGDPITLEKQYLEVWGSEKGEEEEKMKGHTTKHFYNGTLKPATEYKQLINAIIPERMLKMLSDPLFFPEVLQWTEQRAVLEKMGNVTDEMALEQLATPKNDFGAVINILNAKQSLQDRKTRIAYEVKQAKEEKDTIRPGIKQNEITIESFGVIDQKAIQSEIDRINGEISKIDDAISDKVKAEDLQNDQTRAKRTNLNNLKNRQNEIEQLHLNEFNKEKLAANGNKSEIENNVVSLRNSKLSKTKLLQDLEANKAEIEKQTKNLLDEYQEEGKKVMQPISPDKLKCEHCNAPFATDKIEGIKETITNSFKENKKNRLNDINYRGQKLDQSLTEIKESIKSETENLNKISNDLEVEENKLRDIIEKISNQSEIKTVEERLAADAEFTANKQSISGLEVELSQQQQPIDYSELKQQKQDFINLVDVEKRKLNNLDTIKSLTDRNINLADRERVLAQQIATLQREEMEINQFIIGRMELIEKAVRSNFKHVTFKMFEKNIGNGEEKPFCEAWFEGKPFSALNTEAKLNAGLDILNGLSNFYQINVPILIDNRESITEILPVKSQVINFFVSPADKVIRVVNKA